MADRPARDAASEVLIRVPASMIYREAGQTYVTTAGRSMGPFEVARPAAVADQATTCDRASCGATRAEYDHDPCTRQVCGLRPDLLTAHPDFRTAIDAACADLAIRLAEATRQRDTALAEVERLTRAHADCDEAIVDARADRDAQRALREDAERQRDEARAKLADAGYVRDATGRIWRPVSGTLKYETDGRANWWTRRDIEISYGPVEAVGDDGSGT